MEHPLKLSCSAAILAELPASASNPAAVQNGPTGTATVVQRKTTGAIKRSSRFENVCTKADLHALPEWWQSLADIDKQRVPFALWTLVVLVATFMVVWFVASSIKEYIDEPVSSSYSLRNEQALVLPDVYICPPVMVHKMYNFASKVPYLKYYAKDYSDCNKDLVNYYAVSTRTCALWGPNEPQCWRRHAVDTDWMRQNFDNLLDANIDQFTGLLGWLSTASDRDAANFGYGQVASATSRRADEIAGVPVWPPPRPCPRAACPPRPAPYSIWRPSNAEQLYMKLSYQKADFIRECQLGAPDDGSGERDCTQYIEEVFDADYGKCFLLPLHRKRIGQLVPGRGVSIVIDLDFQQSSVSSDRHYIEKNDTRDGCDMNRFSDQINPNKGNVWEDIGKPTKLKKGSATEHHGSADTIFYKDVSVPQGSHDLREDLYKAQENGDVDGNPFFVSGPPDGTCDQREDWQKSTRRRDAAVVRIGSPHDATTKAAILANAGEQTSVLLYMTKMKMVERKSIFSQRACITEEEGEQLLDMLSANQLYSMSLCQFHCSLKEAYTRCGCLKPVARHVIADTYANEPSCSISQMRNCAVNQTELRNVRSELQLCTDGCLTPCEYTSLRMSATSAKFQPRPVKSYIAEEQEKTEQVAAERNKESVVKTPLPEAILSSTLYELGFSADELLPRDADIIKKFKDPSGLGHTCWRPWVRHEVVKYAGCDMPLEQYVPDINRTLEQMGILTEEDYMEHFAWWKLPLTIPDTDYMRRSADVIVLDIAFADMQYTDIEQTSALTLTSCIGTIGGHFGLWLGASIISFVKITMFLIAKCH